MRTIYIVCLINAQGLSPQGTVCVWIGRMCYAVAMISNTIYVMHTMDATLSLLVTGGLLVQLLWFLVHEDFRSIIVGLLLTVVSCT